MTRMVRQLYTAALVAGFGLPAVIARAADPQTYWPDDSTSRVQLVSATEETPQRADESAVRLADPRDADANPADSNPSRSATYPPKKPAKKPAAKPAQKTFTGTPDLQSDQSTITGQQPAASVRRKPQTAQSQPRSGSVARRDSQLTAHYAAEGESPETLRKPVAPPAAPPESGVETSPGESCGACESCCDCPVWCGGLDYLYLRPHFGNDLAMHQLTATTTTGVNGAVTTDDRAIDFNYDYDSDMRFFVGRHVGCGELRFAYTHIQGDANVSGTADGGFASGSGVAFTGLGGTQISDAGESVVATSHLLLNLYDIDYLQHLDLPGCCGAGWDVQWGFGVRIADIGRTIDEFDPVETVNLSSTFVGAGPRVDFQALRNLWGSNFGLFFNADAGLLVGHYRSAFRETTPGILQNTVTTQENDLTRAVPNAELSLGISWRPTCRTTITSGWMVEAFTDAVGSTANTGGCTTCSMINPLAGSGNILSFDGAFIRMEHCF
ncbi:MAG TPA: Lpg1974 family pore-forming outer membrane protein [Pirellulales bacterium]|nr:Lpg1974 family pore-forming outer membrane protein [Pirellulales bacterium]